MNLQLIEGQFSKKDTIDIITQMIHFKIKYLENNIELSDNEEDIKMRECSIKQLQKDLFETRKVIENYKTKIDIQSMIHLSN